MSDTPKKRPWFQFHLSTAVVLMFVAAGQLWMNLGVFEGQLYQSRLGWPLKLYEQRVVSFRSTVTCISTFKGAHVVMDLFLAFAMLSFVGVLHEWFLRRRDHRP
jgi:hypothetical protein